MGDFLNTIYSFLFSFWGSLSSIVALITIVTGVFKLPPWWHQYCTKKMKGCVFEELERRQQTINGALAPTIEDIACWLNSSPKKIRPVVEDLVKDGYLIYDNGRYFF